MSFLKKMFSSDKSVQEKSVQGKSKQEKSAPENGLTENKWEKKGVSITPLASSTSWWATLARKFSATRLSPDESRELEEMLLKSDMGYACTQKLMAQVQAHPGEPVDQVIRHQIGQWLAPLERDFSLDTQAGHPKVIMVIGVNGVGKTTTLGKLAHLIKSAGKKVMIAAGDTFRAAAVEQLIVWGQRNEVSVISQKEGADPAAVIFDAMSAAKSRSADVLLVDTSGRLHNKDNLMKELERIVRVMKKQDENAPHEIWLVLDGTSGQNALTQIKVFNESVPLTGLIFTKMDARQRVGTIVSVATELSTPLPIYFLGFGEALETLERFTVEGFLANW